MRRVAPSIHGWFSLDFLSISLIFLPLLSILCSPTQVFASALVGDGIAAMGARFPMLVKRDNSTTTTSSSFAATCLPCDSAPLAPCGQCLSGQICVYVSRTCQECAMNQCVEATAVVASSATNDASSTTQATTPWLVVGICGVGTLCILVAAILLFVKSRKKATARRGLEKEKAALAALTDDRTSGDHRSSRDAFIPTMRLPAARTSNVSSVYTGYRPSMETTSTTKSGGVTAPAQALTKDPKSTAMGLLLANTRRGSENSGPAETKHPARIPKPLLPEPVTPAGDTLPSRLQQLGPLLPPIDPSLSRLSFSSQNIFFDSPGRPESRVPSMLLSPTVPPSPRPNMPPPRIPEATASTVGSERLSQWWRYSTGSSAWYDHMDNRTSVLSDLSGVSGVAQVNVARVAPVEQRVMSVATNLNKPFIGTMEQYRMSKATRQMPDNGKRASTARHSSNFSLG